MRFASNIVWARFAFLVSDRAREVKPPSPTRTTARSRERDGRQPELFHDSPAQAICHCLTSLVEETAPLEIRRRSALTASLEPFDFVNRSPLGALPVELIVDEHRSSPRLFLYWARLRCICG